MFEDGRQAARRYGLRVDRAREPSERLNSFNTCPKKRHSGLSQRYLHNSVIEELVNVWMVETVSNSQIRCLSSFAVEARVR